MNVTQLINRGLEIHAQISLLSIELKAIEKQLEAVALNGDKIPLTDADREGQQHIAKGTAKQVPIILESDLILGSFKPDSIEHKAIISALGDEHNKHFLSLWKHVNQYDRVPKDGQKYRRDLRKLLPPETAASVLAASLAKDKVGITKSRIVISWDNASALS